MPEARSHSQFVPQPSQPAPHAVNPGVQFDANLRHDPDSPHAVAHAEPVTFEEAMQDPKWVSAMNEEIMAIERNNTWELTDIPEGNNPRMIEEFKNSMMKEFEMTDLGLMSYFLGIEVIQGDDGIFISQKRYVTEFLKKFRMYDCNPVRTPVEVGTKLSKEGDDQYVDSTHFKQIVGSLRQQKE
nr:uncharacterized protein LOC108981514 [Ipomoea trifida]